MKGSGERSESWAEHEGPRTCFVLLKFSTNFKRFKTLKLKELNLHPSFLRFWTQVPEQRLMDPKETVSEDTC